MFDPIEEAIQAIKNGEMIVVVDDEDRENEGDLLMAADCVTPEAINFMATYGKGLICMPSEQKYLQAKNIHEMVQRNTDNYKTAFTVSIDHQDTTTGISAGERCLTIQKFCDPSISGNEFKKPGHIFPLIAKEYGVLRRTGHTEAAVDLAKLAGFQGIGIICEIMKDDGTMARRDDLVKFSKKHNLKMITIADLVNYRKTHDIFIQLDTAINLPTKYGEFKAYTFINKVTQEHHLALVKGNISGDEAVLTRMHSECLTGDALGSQRCDCGEQYAYAMQQIAENGRGILLYLRQEGRGIGLVNKIRAYALQDHGRDTVEANLELGFPDDMRDYAIAAQMYKALGVTNLDLMTNNPSKQEALENYGMVINSRVPIQLPTNKHNHFYLQTKKEKMDHILDNL